VDLSEIFPDTGEKFLCAIYVGRNPITGSMVSFMRNNYTETAGVEEPDLKDGPATTVCFQRFSMIEFVKPAVDQIWFCYMKSSAQAECAERSQAYYNQGIYFLVAFVFFLACLGFIMRDMPEFEKPLLWFTRLLVHLELGLVCVGLLMEYTRVQGAMFSVLAILTNFLCGFLFMMPYQVMEWMDENNPFNIAYLLAMCFCPCFTVEFVSYWPGVIRLVSKWPVLIGLVSFLIKIPIYNWWAEARRKGAGTEDDADARTANSFKYVSVPTNEAAA